MTTNNTVPITIDFEDISETITQVLLRAKESPEEFHKTAASRGIHLERCIALIITHRIHSDLQLAMTKARRKSLAASFNRKQPSSKMH